MADFSMIKEMYQKGYFSIHESFDNWKDAVKASVQPFIDKNLVKKEYADRVVEMVEEYGPYICICPHVAIPHAMAPELVMSETSEICFMKVNKPVEFVGESTDYCELFFALCAPSGQKHMEELVKLVDILEQDGVIEALLEAKTEEDFKKLFDI